MQIITKKLLLDLKCYSKNHLEDSQNINGVKWEFYTQVYKLMEKSSEVLCLKCLGCLTSQWNNWFQNTVVFARLCIHVFFMWGWLEPQWIAAHVWNKSQYLIAIEWGKKSLSESSSHPGNLFILNNINLSITSKATTNEEICKMSW